MLRLPFAFLPNAFALEHCLFFGKCSKLLKHLFNDIINIGQSGRAQRQTAICIVLCAIKRTKLQKADLPTKRQNENNLDNYNEVAVECRDNRAQDKVKD